MKFNQDILRNWLPLNADPLQNKIAKEYLANRLGDIAISMIMVSPEGKVLKTLPWDYLESDTRFQLQQAVCEVVQNMSHNNQVMERLQGIGVNSNSFNMSIDTTNWLLTSDALGMYAKQLIVRSGIRDYKWIQDDLVWTTLPNGNIKIIKGAI